MTSKELNEIYDLIKQKIENAENDRERLIEAINRTYSYEVEQRGTDSLKELNGEINAYTDIKILIETSGVLEKPSKDDLIEMLSPREQYVLKEREQGKTYEEIGKKKNITRERVRQIENIATRKLNALIEKYKVNDNGQISFL